MHRKTDSEVTSLATSSPPRSPPRRPLYYVQSPSRDSHDGEKTIVTSYHSTPLDSPPHSSSSTRFSASQAKKEHYHQHQQSLKPWKDVDVIEEEGFLHEEDRNGGFSRRCYFFAFVVGFFVLFSLFCLILWSASRPMKPEIIIQSIKFDRIIVQAGSDSTGVATDMITMNSTLKFTYRNTGTFFGVHVSATPLELSYSDIVIASGNMKEFHQSRKSHKLVRVAVMGSKVPLYGSGASLSSTTGVPTLPVPLTLNFVMRSRGYVLGELVKPKYYKRIQCSINLDPKKLGTQVSLKNSCTYD